jgi:hypothetical protein
MKRISVWFAAVALAWMLPGAAFAWGWQGHEYVGNLAYDLLSSKARSRVNVLLGAYSPGQPVSLAAAAVWPDCIRDVHGPDEGPHKFKLTASTSKPCRPFGNSKPEVARMEDYADRNWTNCEYAHHKRECHKAYHFDDVNVHEHTDYSPTYFGAPDSDAVRGIKAAITVLQCGAGSACTYEGPFKIRDKREALFLLAHLIGDLHQPLHAGAIYLDDTDQPAGDGQGRENAGGNFLLATPGAKESNLHHKWDAIHLATSPTLTVVKQACQVQLTGASLLDRPAIWASESVGKARDAYANIIFSKDPTLNGYWDAKLPAGYDERSVQAARLELAGARLAEVLNAIWPGGSNAEACT